MEELIRAVRIVRDAVEDLDVYPFTIPTIRAVEELELDGGVTFLVGENGSGKSTLIERSRSPLASTPRGGSRNMRFATRPSESNLHAHLRLVRAARRPKDGDFPVAYEDTAHFLITRDFLNHRERYLQQLLG
jgi:predicted ATPase